MNIALIDDVLDTVFCHCDPSSLSILTRVSSRFSALALPHLLHSVSFEKDLTHLVSFLNLITSDDHRQDVGDPGLGRHVRRLRIASEALMKNRRWHTAQSMTMAEVEAVTEYTETVPIPTWAPLLTSALRLMPNLHEFMFGDDFELDAISLGRIGTEVSASLGNAWSTFAPAFQLESLSLFGGNDRMFEKPLKVVPEDGLGRFLLQSHTQKHVRSLQLSNFDFNAFTPFSNHVLFPSLIKLEISDCHLPLSWLAAAAPGIHTLVVYGGRIHSSGSFPQVAFPQLVHLAASFLQLVMLMQSNALALHRLRRLRLNFGWGINGDHERSESFAVARAATSLESLAFSQHTLQDPSWWQAFGEALPPLKSLTISLNVGHSADRARVCCFEVPSALATVPLEYVSLTIKGRALGRPEDFDITMKPAEGGIAVSWASKIPTLQYMDIRLQRNWGPPDRTRLFLTIERGDDSVSVRESSAQAGLKVKEAYEGGPRGGNLTRF
ncbi:hypothetical protein BKA70DRAFT_1411953 [Coprinopsis sp. MPI-PUGE-AT-0042]|nr:hypothetical protein BKA70DRAFT_1411953 [Coprinopsis sp. MPI-PUGE-AT-0042]